MKSTATVNPLLSGAAVKYMRNPGGFVGARLFPAFKSGVASSEYYVFDTENFLGVPRNIRHAPGAAYKRVMPKLSSDTYNCRDYGLEQPVPDQDRAKYAGSFNADLSAIRRLTDFIKINHEIRVKEKATDPNVVPHADIAVQWDQAVSNPKADVDFGKEEIRKACGMRPNTMIISRTVMNALETHPKIADLFKYTTPGLMDAEKLKNYFGIENIFVAEQTVATNQEGQPITVSDIWADDVVLAIVQPGDDLMLLNFGRTIYWSAFGKVTGEDEVPIQIESYRDNPVASDVHRAQHATDEKLTAPAAGFLLRNALT
ncbi:MAG TPA: hypothetical protein VN673_11215 [Clostridia bacterium]|nr:hypothetical protein [Clostridia bacterium]